MILVLAAAAALAAPPAGASACSGCHGAPTSGAAPSLRGRTEAEIVAAMTEFRAGKRPATVMDRIAKGFTEDETRAIAAYLGGRK